MIERIIWAISCFGAKERKGYVELRIEDKRIQIPIEQARELGLNILQAAEAAETDEFLMTFLGERVGLQDDVSKVQVLMDFRNWRDQKRREKPTP